MNHPLIPLGDTPKDGDFVRYLELLTPSLSPTTDTGQLMGADAQAATWRLPEATRALLQIPPTSAPNGGGAQGAVRQAGARPAPDAGPRSTTVGTRRPAADDAAWGSGSAVTVASGAKASSIRTQTSAGDAPAAPDGPPDLAALLDPLRGLIGRALIAIGVIWFVLGGPLGFRAFEDSIGVAMFLIFGGIFLHQSQRRRPPKA